MVPFMAALLVAAESPNAAVDADRELIINKIRQLPNTLTEKVRLF